jgi:hypothetical protein
VDQLCLSQQSKTVDQLLSENAYKGRGQSAELILLDQLVKVDAEQLEDQTQVLPVDEGILQSQQMVVVVLVHLLVQLKVRQQSCATRARKGTHQIEDRHLHHTLVEVGRAVLDNFDSNHFLGL